MQRCLRLISVVALVTLFIKSCESHTSNFISTPGVCATYIGSSCTFLWTVSPPIGPDDFGSQAVFHGDTTDASGLIYQASAVNGSSRGTSNEYIDRDVAWAGSSINPGDGGDTIGVTINNIQESDAGTFTCSYAYDHPYGIIDNNSIIFIFIKPYQAEITPGNDILEVREGSSTVLTCSISSTSKPPAYRPPVKYAWFRDGTKLNEESSQLTLYSLDRTQHGHRISCSGQEIGSPMVSKKSNQVQLRVKYPPGPALAASFEILLGQSATLECVVSEPGRPTAHFYWQRVISDGDNVECFNSTCEISDSDLGNTEFMCQPLNSIGAGTPAKITLITSGITLKSPISQMDVEVRVNATLNMTCEFEAFPDISVTWDRDGGNLPDAVKVIQTSDAVSGFTMTTSVVSWTSESSSSDRSGAGGRYRCTGQRGQSSLIGVFQLDVHGPPRINFTVPHTRTIEAELGENVVFVIDVFSNPIPERFRWSFNSVAAELPGNAATTSEREQETRLTITDVKQENYGVYSCVVTNSVGQSDPVEFTVRAPASRLSMAAIVGGACGMIGIIVTIVIVAVLLLRWRSQKKRETEGKENEGYATSDKAPDGILHFYSLKEIDNQ